VLNKKGFSPSKKLALKTSFFVHLLGNFLVQGFKMNGNNLRYYCFQKLKYFSKEGLNCESIFKCVKVITMCGSRHALLKKMPFNLHALHAFGTGQQAGLGLLSPMGLLFTFLQ
jgi:hypothetical protein